MSSRLRARNRVARYIFSIFFIVAAFALSFAPQTTGAASPLGMTWQRHTEDVFSKFGFDPPTWSANVRANTDTTGNGQHEPALAVSPANPNVVVIANKDYREGDIKHVWIEASRDGGQSWPTQLRMTNGITTDTESDPVVIARDDGRIYVSCLTTGNNGVFITWSDDNGVSWQPARAIVQNQSGLQDKDWFAVDNNPSSPYYHRVYMAWAPGGVVSSYSSDGGLTWSTPQQIPNGGGSIEYPYPVVAPNGDVFIFHMYNWNNRGSNPSIVKVDKSTDGGVTWSQPVNVATIYQPNSPPRTGDQWRFYSIISAATDPTNNNRLYAAWTDNRNINTNGLDVQYSASTDHGTSWSPITRLSHDPTGVVRDHITPILNVSADGRLNALWLDRRLDAANHLFQAWYSSSTDGGTSWEADSQVSDAPGLGFDLNVGLPPGSGNAAGDYWGLGSAGGYVYAAWTDTRINSQQDIFTSRGIRSGGTPVPTNTPSATPSPTATTEPSGTPIATATPCVMNFSDVSPSDYFYEAVRYLYCAGIVSGYGDGTFRPYNNATRAQLTKIIVLAEGWSVDCPDTGHFSDVPTDHPFFCYIETAYEHSIISGYGDGTFRPDNNVTRAQLCKIIVLAQQWPIDTSGGPHFSDVPTSHPFYSYIETAYNHSIITGYGDGAFRPDNSATRGQISKIVYQAITLFH